MRVVFILLMIAVFAWADTLNDGSMATDRGDHREAVKQFTQAIKIDSYNAGTYNYRGNSYAKLGDHKKAAEDAKKACDLGSCDLLQVLKVVGNIRD